MRLLIHILILLPLYSVAQDTDSVPGTPILPESRILLPLTIKEKPAGNKYSFKPVFTSSVKKRFNTNGQTVIQSFYNQPTGMLHYNLSLEALDFIENYRRKNEGGLRSMKNWGAFLLSSMERILVQNGIPKQLVYVAIIESDLQNSCVSWCGASGIWQFMPETARNYGLYVGNGLDERFDWYKSTFAAAKYLKELYILFDDWLLALASYNGGPGRVRAAIRKSGSRNFWDLQYYLPAESRTYVKKFIATQYIMDGSTGIASVDFNNYQPKPFFNPLAKGAVAIDTLKNKMKEIEISGRYNSLVIAKNIMLDIISFNILNPGFDDDIAKNSSSYLLRLPEDKMELFNANRLQIMNESLQLFLSLQGVVNNDLSPVQPVRRKQ
jgi:membrane-bound lytic murein transglycosylase D